MILTNFIILIIIQLGICDYATHEFYVSTTSVDFVLDKKEIQITSQFFIDDVENLIKFQTPNTTFFFEKKIVKTLIYFWEILLTKILNYQLTKKNRN